MKNIKIQKKAFTLVELIVVITILAILGTIAFISLQGNTQDAKNTKVVSDVANIHKKVSIRIAEENAPVLADFFLSGSSISANKHSNTSTGAGLSLASNYDVGTIDFSTLQESSDKFKDSDGKDYIYAYAGNKVYQVAGVITNSDTGAKEAVVRGNYYEADPSDVDGLIKDAAGTTAAVTDGGSILPY